MDIQSCDMGEIGIAHRYNTEYKNIFDSMLAYFIELYLVAKVSSVK